MENKDKKKIDWLVLNTTLLFFACIGMFFLIGYLGG